MYGDEPIQIVFPTGTVAAGPFVAHVDTLAENQRGDAVRLRQIERHAP